MSGHGRAVSVEGHGLASLDHGVRGNRVGDVGIQNLGRIFE